MDSSELKISGLVLPGNLFLAPMAGFTDSAFRSISIDNGATLAFTEMISAEAVCRGNKKTLKLAKRSFNAKYHALQLFGNDPSRCGEASKSLLEFKPNIIDLNCGCPVPKVIKTGSGAALMKNPSQIFKIVSEIKKNSEKQGDVKITLKIRSGWDNDNLNYLECAKAGCDAGASMISFHPRTRAQGYSGKSNWSLIADLKSKIDLPVCGSGDLFSAEDAKNMFETTGCDAVMFARGAIGKPWIFNQTKRLLDCKEIKELTLDDKMTIAWQHLILSVKDSGEYNAVKEMKKQLCGYTKGINQGKEIRNEFVRCNSLAEYKNVFERYFSGIDFANIQ